MSELTPKVLATARQLIVDRGHSYRYSSGPNSPLNIRSAVSAACTALVPYAQSSVWHAEYIAAINVLSTCAGESVGSWEYQATGSRPRGRSQAEVLELFGMSISRLDRAGGRS